MTLLSGIHVILLRFAAIALLGALAARPASAQTDATGTRVTLPGTIAHNLESRMVGDRYRISVGLPSSYAQDTTRRYPVLYLLDADKSFGLARDLADWLAWSREIEPLIVIGIGYESDWWAKRARDMTAAPDRSRRWGNFPTAGGAAAFSSFLGQELIPFIERSYRANSERRTLAGLSFGGLFAAWSMFRSPELFSGYIMVAPAFAWDSSAIERDEARFAATRRALPARVYSAIGEHDDPHVPATWHTVMARIRQRQYTGLELYTEVLAGESHISSWPVGLTRGMKRLFPVPR